MSEIELSRPGSPVFDEEPSEKTRTNKVIDAFIYQDARNKSRKAKIRDKEDPNDLWASGRQNKATKMLMQKNLGEFYAKPKNTCEHLQYWFDKYYKNNSAAVRAKGLTAKGLGKIVTAFFINKVLRLPTFVTDYHDSKEGKAGAVTRRWINSLSRKKYKSANENLAIEFVIMVETAIEDENTISYFLDCFPGYEPKEKAESKHKKMTKFIDKINNDINADKRHAKIIRDALWDVKDKFYKAFVSDIQRKEEEKAKKAAKQNQ